MAKRKREIITKPKTIAARKKVRRFKRKETTTIIIVVLLLALIDAALVAAVLMYNEAHSHDETDEPKEFKYHEYSQSGTITSEGRYYDSSKTGSGVDVDMKKVESEIDAYDYDDFVLSKRETDFAVIRIENYGDIIVALRSDIAPLTVNNFKALVLKDFYDDTLVHRVVKDFMIQGGGMKKEGETAKPDSIKGEFTQNGHQNKLLHVRGVISMARTSEKDSATSQFFIMHKASVDLDEKYASFGYVLAGLDVVDAITKCEVKASSVSGEKSEPTTQIVIKDIFFVEPKKDTGIATTKKDANTETYTVNIVDANNSPIQGVSFKLVNTSTNKDVVYGITDEDGEALLDVAVTAYYVKIISANGYSYEDRYDLPENSTKITVKLEKTKAEE